MLQAMGIVEVKSLVGAIEAADAMLKAANVNLTDFQIVGSGIVCVTVTGDVGAVIASVESGKEHAQKIAEIISVNVIPRPHDEVGKII
jgi:Carbon dioxide concentrating mechanism/carboxysome shell protein